MPRKARSTSWNAAGLIGDGFVSTHSPCQITPGFFDIGEQLVLRRGEALLIEHAPTVELGKVLKIANERSPGV